MWFSAPLPVFAAVVALAAAAYDPAKPETAFELADEVPGQNTNDEMKTLFTQAFEGQHNCGITGQIATKPRSLSFCHKFNDKSCCAPAMDDENTEMFDILTGLGLSCRLRGDIREDPIAKWYCLNCDPEQPKYVRPVMFEDVTGDGSPTGGRSATILVSRAWAFDGFSVDPILSGPGNRFQQCGLKKSSPCLDVNGDIIPDRDRFTCGDDLVIPASYKQMDDNDIVDNIKSIEAFMNADSMGPPVLDEMYGFKLVNAVDCTETELIALYAEATPDKVKNAAGSIEVQNPDCLRSADQLIKTKYWFGGSAAGLTSIERTFRDHFCNYGFGTEALAGDGDPGHYAKEDCTQVRPTTGATINPGDDDDKCNDAAERQKFPCCCGAWNKELAFSGAAQLAPAALSVVVAVVALLW